jgi:16S rRNA U516 pseudouridylate synthase RsuA-like enzyme
MQKKKLNETPKDTYPMRINKYLAHKGLATRTGVDELIKSHKILINGKVAVLGDKVMENDKVEVRKGRVTLERNETVASLVLF